MEQANDGVDETMNVYFNDVTLTSSGPQNIMFLQDMKVVWDDFMRQTNGVVKFMRSLPCDESEKLAMLATDVIQSGDTELITFFSHKIVPGYKQEIQSDDDLTVSDYWVECSPGDKVPCEIMGWAMRHQEITFGLASSRFWNRPSPSIDFIVDEYDPDQDIIVQSHAVVDCVTRKDHLDKIQFCHVSEDDDIEEICDPPDIVHHRKYGEIIVLGAVRVYELKQVAADFGLDINRFNFIPYERVSNYDCRKWKDSGHIAAIMCGAVPHSGAGMGDSNSFYDTIRTEAGYPPVEPLQESTGKLKVTINSFRLGLINLMKKKVIDRNFD